MTAPPDPDDRQIYGTICNRNGIVYLRLLLGDSERIIEGIGGISMNSEELLCMYLWGLDNDIEVFVAENGAVIARIPISEG